MSTRELFRQDAYLTHCSARIQRLARDADGQLLGLELDQTVFYPLGGGQAGDRGQISLPDGTVLPIADTRKAKDATGVPTGGILHVLDTAFLSDSSRVSPVFLDSLLSNLIATQTEVTAQLDWNTRHKHMRFHTATHLLCHVVPHPVDGCSITAEQARLDFHTAEPLDKDAIQAALTALVTAAWDVRIGQVTDAELDANPGLVRSMSVQPPRGHGVVRTICVGNAQTPIDLQPCGGTHVANTAEIGAVLVAKIEKKSAQSRRISLRWGT